MSEHKHPNEFEMSEADVRSRLEQTYGPYGPGKVLASTYISWFVDRANWYEMARAVHYGLDVYDFVIDEASQIAFCGVDTHANLIPALLELKTGWTGDSFEAEDKWVIDGHGCFKSKAGAQILMSATYKLPPELKLLAYRSVVIE